ncbi:unnamed protein product [Sphagnum balticum]
MSAGTMVQEAPTTWKDVCADRDDDTVPDQDRKAVNEGDDASASDSDNESDTSEYYYSKSNQLEQIDSEDEFVDAEFEELQHCPEHDPAIPMLLQTVQVRDGDSGREPIEKFASSGRCELGIRWKEIRERIKIDTDLDDDDFGEEIQDIAGAQADAPGEEGGLLCMQTGEETEWMGVRRKDRRSIDHNACCFGINHWTCVGNHQLYMLDVAPKEDQPEESVPDEEAVLTGNEPVQYEET